MKRLSGHLDGLASEVHRVEHAIGEDMFPSQVIGGAAITQLQSLDYLRQSLEDLALLTHFLGQNDVEGDGRSGWQDPARVSGQLRLHSTRALFGAARQDSGVRATGVVGEVDLF